MRVNGNQVLNFVGYTGNQPVQGIRFNARSVAERTRSYDDIYIHIPDEGENGFLGDVSVCAVFPYSDISTDFVPTSGDNIYNIINKIDPVNNEYDHGKTGSSTVHTIENLTNKLGYIPEKIHAIQLVSRIMPEGSPRKINGIFKVGNKIQNVVFNSLEADSVFSYIVSESIDKDPNGENWTVESINQLITGIKIA